MRFRHAAVVGKYQARGIRPVLEEVAHFLIEQGLDVCFDRETAAATGVAHYEALSTAEIGARCDLAVVVGGDGTMLGIARELARHNLPLVGINQGRLGFITDVPIDRFKESLAPMLAGDYEEEHRTMLDGSVWRDASANFDMHSLTSLLHGDQVRVRRSAHKVRFLHPRGWSYYATLRRKLRWYEGVV